MMNTYQTNNYENDIDMMMKIPTIKRSMTFDMDDENQTQYYEKIQESPQTVVTNLSLEIMMNTYQTNNNKNNIDMMKIPAITRSVTFDMDENQIQHYENVQSPKTFTNRSIGLCPPPNIFKANYARRKCYGNEEMKFAPRVPTLNENDEDDSAVEMEWCEGGDIHILPRYSEYNDCLFSVMTSEFPDKLQIPALNTISSAYDHIGYFKMKVEASDDKVEICTPSLFPRLEMNAKSDNMLSYLNQRQTNTHRVKIISRQATGRSLYRASAA